MIIRFLGTGTSNGVPIIGCHCPVCTSADPKNKRFRCSLSIENEKGRVIIDTPPEFRLQCIRENINSLNAVLYTHDHADHLFGLDDLRGFTVLTNKPIPVYGDKTTIESIHRDFNYLFRKPVNKSPIAKIETHIIDRKPINLIGTDFIPIHIKHGKFDILAYKFGSCMYCTDCSYIPEHSRKHFYNLDILILDALRYAPHPTHLTLNKALKIIDEFKPKKAYLTHTTHYFEYNEVSQLLPPNVEMAYDTLKLTL